MAQPCDVSAIVISGQLFRPPMATARHVEGVQNRLRNIKDTLTIYLLAKRLRDDPTVASRVICANGTLVDLMATAACGAPDTPPASVSQTNPVDLGVST
ncbi:MAG TPA: hypothetical protein VL147_22460 [Devosia sp.]|nr:hypothetical protein [Devosia sp.]